MAANASHQSQENTDNGQRAAAQPAAVGQLRQAASPSADAQRAEPGNLSDIANGSPRAAKFKALTQLLRQSPQARQQRALAQEIDNSPRMAEQRKTTGALAGAAIQRQTAEAAQAAQKPNRTGLPDGLKSGVESLSGMSMDHVQVHYNSPQPAQLNSHAYAQGSDIHVAPGQEKHLPHEAWHVVQQAQGRVVPTVQMKGGVAVNDNAALEREADIMGAKAIASVAAISNQGASAIAQHANNGAVAQRQIGDDGDFKKVIEIRTREIYFAVRNTIGSYDLYSGKEFGTYALNVTVDDPNYVLLSEYNEISQSEKSDDSDERDSEKEDQESFSISFGKGRDRRVRTTVPTVKEGEQETEMQRLHFRKKSKPKKKERKKNNDIDDQKIDYSYAEMSEAFHGAKKKKRMSSKEIDDAIRIGTEIPVKDGSIELDDEKDKYMQLIPLHLLAYQHFHTPPNFLPPRAYRYAADDWR